MDNSADHPKREIALKRWRHLRKMLASGRCRLENGDASVSVRRFTSFGLFKTKLVASDTEQQSDDQQNSWFDYSCKTHHGILTAKIRHLDTSINMQTLLGFNNTGNVCVWPSEEVLAYFCLQRLSHFKNLSVCEIGGGMTCLAGIFLAVHGEAREVLLTDGNERSVHNVDEIIKMNSSHFGSTVVQSKVLQWNDEASVAELENSFDVIICADCLFFNDVARDLINTIERLLKPKGEAIIFAPTRGDTLTSFKDLALRKFSVTFTTQYDAHVLELHKQNLEKGLEFYDENLHYPLLLQLRKPYYEEDSDE